MRLTVTLSANAGVALDLDGRRIWVDALHEKKQPGFSALSPQLQQKMLNCPAFFEPEYICYTHRHDDHYSARLTKTAQKLWPGAKVLEGGSLEDNGLCLRFVRLPHEGEQYADVDHHGVIVSYRGCNVLVSGDCAVASPVLADTIGDTPIHAALLDFPWATLRKGRQYLREHFRETRILLYHLPFSEDDTQGYRQAACRAVEQLRKELDISVLWDPLQTEEVII